MKNNFPDLNYQMDTINSNLSEIVPEEELERKIQSSLDTKTPLMIKFGCDPSMPDLHLGHSVILNKLRQFQELGHTAVLIIGDFTAMIGDPSGKNKTRPKLSLEQTSENSKTYVDQAMLILSKSNLRIEKNSKWLGRLNFNDVIEIASKYTVARMLERDDFTKRYSSGAPISIHEFLYPLAQGYDSIAVDSDIELGGTDQKFNLLVGRSLQKDYNMSPQCIITMPIIEGLDGKEKMSKSNNNYIALTDGPDEIFGKTMSIPDSLIAKYFQYCTHASADELDIINEKLGNLSCNPRDLKHDLAFKLVEIYHSVDEATKAKENFVNVFSKDKIPDNVDEYIIQNNKESLISIMINSKMVISKSEARRLINQGAVRLDSNKVSDPFLVIQSNKNLMLKVGKRKFLKII